jgi:hypothetical protein
VRKPVRWLIVVLALSVLGGCLAARPKARKRVSVPSVLLVFGLARLGFDWDPLSWASSAEKEAGKILKTIVSWVVKEAVKLGNLIQNDVVDVYHSLSTDFGVLTSEVTYLFSQLGSDVGVGVKFIRKLISDAVSAAERALRDVISGIDTFAHDVYRDADNWYHDALHWAAADERWWWDHVIEPAIHAVEAGGKDVEKYLDAWWQTIDRDVIRPIEHDAAEGLNDAVKALYWIDHAGYDAVKLVEEAAGWLVAFAEHPLSELESLPAGLAKLITQGWIEQTAAGTPGLFEQLASEVTQVLE